MQAMKYINKCLLIKGNSGVTNAPFPKAVRTAMIKPQESMQLFCETPDRFQTG